MTREAPDSMPGWDRPIRFPDGVDIAHADPAFAIAGETSTWRLPFVLSREAPAGTTLKLQVAGGRSNKGPFACQALCATLADGRPLDVTETENSGTYVLSMPPTGLNPGDQLTVTLADCDAPKIRQLNKFFVLYVERPEDSRPSASPERGALVWADEGEDLIAALCTMHILGGTFHHLRAYAPSHAMPGDEVDILVRPEDEFDNLSHERPAEFSVYLGDEELSHTFEAVDDSTCVRARVTLAKAGTHRLRVVEHATGYEAETNPIVCGGEEIVFWGLLHGHTEMSDGTGTLEQYFHQLSNEAALDFAAPGDHDHRWETSDAFWRTTCEAVRRWNRPGRFVTFLGYEWAKWRRNGDGDRNVYFLNDDRPMYRSEDGEFPSPPDLFGALARNQERAIVCPHHTAHGGNFCDWKDHDEAFERLVEIFQVNGSYECSAQDGNPVPAKVNKFEAYPPGYVRNALALGWRVGFTAGGDDHTGRWGTEARFGAYKQGLLCVEARERSRESIFAAMYNRRVTATTGARMLLTYRLNGNPMGSELSMTALPELAIRRTLCIEFHGTAAVDRIDIIRNNIVVHSASAAQERDVAITWDDRDTENLWLPATKFCDHPFLFYYVRVVQQDGEVAWASPVWVDP